MNSSQERVLIVKFGAIGDVMMAIPAAHALHSAGYAIDWVCGAQVRPILECYPWINLIVADDWALVRGGTAARVRALLQLWRRIAGRRYAIAATLYYDKRYKLLAMPVRAQRKILLSRTERGLRLMPGRHHTDEFARILSGREDGEWPVGLAPVRPERLPPSPLAREEGKTRVVIAPAGARNMQRDDALRRWPAERYVDLAQRLVEQGFEVVLIGGPDDAWVSPLFAGVGVTDLIGRLALPETLALLDEADVMVTHDTGPLHMAGVTRVGIVTIFGPVDPRSRLPQRANAVAIWGGEGFACRPCYDGHDFAPCKENGCMLQVSVEMVLREVKTVVEQRKGAGAPPRVVVPDSTVVAGIGSAR